MEFVELEKMKKGEKINDSRTRNVYYRRKEKDAHLYKIMKDAYAYFQKKEILLQSMHLYNTKNKGMNNSVAKYTQKIRTFSRAMSL